MASLKERLADTCVCGHHGSEHTANDAGSYIALGSCTAQNGVTGRCSCQQFRRTHNQQHRAGKQSHPGHGRYSKKHYRI
ncbi:MAG TPA: hypothetical protein VKR60_06260 [Candidatus Sulfotelmatobacter sp.]|nr:hypothetical protein [Candidatus Sulfotelmatobacter sp.]